MLKDLEDKLKISEDIKTQIITIKDTTYLIAFSKDLGDIEEFNRFYFPKIDFSNFDNLINQFPHIVTNIKLDIDELINAMFINNILIINDNLAFGFLIPKNTSRSISNSLIDPVDLYSSQDGFIENLDINIALIRKHLKSKKMKVDFFNLPTDSTNRIAIISLDNNSDYTTVIKEKLSTITCENINSINTISQIFQKNKLVPMTLSTSSPQNVSIALTKGKTAILVNNSPVACIVPVNFLLFSTMKNDIDTPKYYSIVSRILVLIFMFISVFLLGLYVAITNYHTSSLTIYALSNLKLTERGTTLPMLSEILIVLLLFELYRYATSRSSNGSIQNIIIFLGGLFIGQNAINSGLIGHLVLLLTSICYLSTYAFTNNLHMVTTLSLFRIFILIFSYLIGLYGFIISSIIILVYLLKLKSFDQDFFFSISNYKFKKIFNYFVPKEDKK